MKQKTAWEKIHAKGNKSPVCQWCNDNDGRHNIRVFDGQGVCINCLRRVEAEHNERVRN